MTVRILASGVDTLHLFSRAPVREDAAVLLDEAKTFAAEKPRGQKGEPFDIAGHQLTVRSHGARTAPLLLESEHMALRVNPAAATNLPTVGVELRALYLWQRGAHVCATEAQRVAEAITVAPPPGTDTAPLSVTRADLAVDFQGWEPSQADDERFVTRASQRTLHRQGRRFTGYMFGHGVIAARLYDKTEELKHSGKAWFRKVWAEHPAFDPRAPVWRLEYQVRREGLRNMRIPGAVPGAPPRHVDTWPDLLDLAAAVWHYLSVRWLSLRYPRTKETRQRLAPEWAALSAGGFSGGVWGGADGDLFREARAAAAQGTTAQLAGYLATGLAEHRYLEDPAASLEEALPVLLDRVRRHGARRGLTVEARAQARVEAWEEQTESMAHGSHADAAKERTP